MNVLPVLLFLLLQLTANTLGSTNQTANGSPAASTIPTLLVNPINRNATSTGASANAIATASAAVNSTVTVVATSDTGKGTVIQNVQAKLNSANSTADVAKRLQVDQDKPVKVNGTPDLSPVLARGVTNTDTATEQAPLSVNATNATQIEHQIKTTAATVIPKQPSPMPNTSKILADGVSMSDINSNSNNNKSSSNTKNTTPAIAVNENANNISSSTNSSTSTSTTPKTTTTTTSTTTTTTMRPKKPTVTFSMDKALEGEKLDASANGSVAPHALPVQEMSTSVHRDDNEYIVAIVTIMLAVPLAIAVFIIMYRRFRDLWSTRHYRRMDFLVDGMYND